MMTTTAMVRAHPCEPFTRSTNKNYAKSGIEKCHLTNQLQSFINSLTHSLTHLPTQ